jgi:hypothetical protein
MYLIGFMSIGKTVLGKFAIQTPIREERVNEIDAKVMAALVFEDITPSPLLTSSPCTSKELLNFVNMFIMNPNSEKVYKG